MVLLASSALTCTWRSTGFINTLSTPPPDNDHEIRPAAILLMVWITSCDMKRSIEGGGRREVEGLVMVVVVMA